MLALVVGLLLAPLLAEGGYRLALRFQGEPYSRERALIELRELAARADGEFIQPEAEDAASNDEGWMLHPFLGFELGRAGKQIARDLERQAGGADEFTVLVTGGSVAAIFDLHGGETLGELIADAAPVGGRRVRRLNYARPAFKQPQQLNRLNYLLASGLRPDCVVEIDGLNELVLSNINASAGVNPDWPSARPWAGATGVSASGRGGLAPGAIELLGAMSSVRRQLRRGADAALDHSWRMASAIYGRRILKSLRGLERRLVGATEVWTEVALGEAGKRRLAGPEFGGSEEERLARSVALWKECSLSMWAACRARGIAYVHVLQPTLHDPGSKELTAAELETSTVRDEWRSAVAIGYPLMREAGAELAEAGVPFVDATRVFADYEGDIYHDPCHFRLPGCAMLAELVAPAVIEAAKGAGD